MPSWKWTRVLVVLGISIAGSDANSACRCILLYRKYDFSFILTFTQQIPTPPLLTRDLITQSHAHRR